MALLVTKTTSSKATSSVFEKGGITYKSFNVEKSSPPKPLLIVTPTVKGLYPVILFCHGFYLRNGFYSKLLEHIASHGFILVAPQFYYWKPISGPDEVNYAAKVTDWLSEGLQSLLPEKVEANLLKLALLGHSRGGKTAFALALGHAQTKSKFSVLLGIDPVAGATKGCRTLPHILTYVPQSFDLSIPVAVIGTGLGSEQSSCCAPPCAPDGLNHKEFYNECKPPCAYFVVKDYGHMDMLDDHPPGIVGELSGCICKNGKNPRDLMRRSVGGLVVAFLKSYLYGENEDLEAIVADPDLAPAKLDPVQLVAA
ncbi:Chlorophyllase [Quillaja saponaria]|uniref:chlorophyllase n=1 Tax=Quillaja saponaria TaxID=32244 RepID=A0AAD7LQH4_QUISA|nr:Chlorophyllase [Quillaja saponaria]